MTDEIIIVSGHPRSGTSLMMQILESAGVNVFIDREVRDDHNPYGYYEIPHVIPFLKPGVVPLLDYSKGKAIKITAGSLHILLSHKNYKYRIIFMTRKLDDIERSFSKLNKARGLPIASKEVINRVIQSGIRVANELGETTFISYDNLVKNPLEELSKIKFTNLTGAEKVICQSTIK